MCSAPCPLWGAGRQRQIQPSLESRSSQSPVLVLGISAVIQGSRGPWEHGVLTQVEKDMLNSMGSQGGLPGGSDYEAAFQEKSWPGKGEGYSI